jgi:2-oxo-3-hexenedioate decarboxylase
MTITLSRENVALLTDRIEVAQNSAQPIAKLTNDFPAMTVADGYAEQLELRRRWLAEGRRQVGRKAGLTSKDKMDQIGVFAPGLGFLMADMARHEN